ncbi:MAG: GNAT family N-acetyltransferase [Aliidiomarina sp.]|uniref:GNAT family N-acetyltransferase n=1 Tax=Aliidiomarina sp. TaxID=1872439 RepID=UPI0025C0376C|nr:N-acetyltransferase [Aliidiomarina sp.]MCH8502133.1 GNAT family N-acetyltransferase [Aliidiomarina sp.]
MQISSAQIFDIPTIAKLERDEYGAEGYPETFFWQALAQWPSLLLIARNESSANAPLAYVLAAPGQTAGQAWIMSLLTVPAGRGQGLGRRLMDAIITQLQLAGYAEVLLTVSPANRAAISLYQQLGFRILTEKKDYLGPGQDRYLMSLPLTD